MYDIRCLLVVAVLVAALLAGTTTAARTAPLIVDHASTNLSAVPASAVADAKAALHVAYGHTSHGSQLVDGMTGLMSFAGAPLPSATYAWSEGGSGGALDLDDYFVDGDLGNPDFSSWATKTRTYLDRPENSDVNVIMWSWCGQVSWASEADIAAYLSLMDGLERDYPSVTFVYMTGHLDGSGLSGNLNLRNNQIRDWCRSHNRVLYDFADIESFDPDGNGYLALGADDGCNYEGGNWATAWQNAHTEGVDWYACDAAHTQPLNANRKAYAAWHLFARLAGWSGGIGPTVTTTVPTPTPPASISPGIGWQQLLGGLEADNGYSMNRTTDGGYILLGESASSRSGDVTGTNSGDRDMWLVKLNGTGGIRWETLLGGDRADWGRCVRQTPDGGYILLGETESSGDAVGGTNQGGTDVRVAKLSSTGTIEWQRLLGGSGWDFGHAIRRTADGGYILLGNSNSNTMPGMSVNETNNGGHDFWVVKLDGAGAVQWQKLLGGDHDEYGRSVLQAPDGGYLLLGHSNSNANGDVTGTNRAGDIWMVKLDGAGAVQWDRLLGGWGDERAAYESSLQPAGDGGFIFVGDSSSSADEYVTDTGHGQFDCWAVKLDSAGTIQWSRLLGGSGDDGGRSVLQDADGGYLLLGESRSNASGNVSGATNGGVDEWVVKLDSSGQVRWQQLLGGGGDEHAYTIVEAPGGGFVLLGNSDSSASGNVTMTNHGRSDIWVVNLVVGPPVVALPGGSAVPTDTDDDGLYDDVNGNGRADFGDVILYFNQMAWIGANEPIAAFDFNDNGRIDFADVVQLFDNL